jgi:hypothetical protein
MFSKTPASAFQILKEEQVSNCKVKDLLGDDTSLVTAFVTTKDTIGTVLKVENHLPQLPLLLLFSCAALFIFSSN